MHTASTSRPPPPHAGCTETIELAYPYSNRLLGGPSTLHTPQFCTEEGTGWFCARSTAPAPYGTVAPPQHRTEHAPPSTKVHDLAGLFGQSQFILSPTCRIPSTTRKNTRKLPYAPPPPPPTAADPVVYTGEHVPPTPPPTPPPDNSHDSSWGDTDNQLVPNTIIKDCSTHCTGPTGPTGDSATGATEAEAIWISDSDDDSGGMANNVQEQGANVQVQPETQPRVVPVEKERTLVASARGGAQR